MTRKQRWLRFAYVANILFVCALVAHQIRLYVEEPEFESVHAKQVPDIRQLLERKSAYRFAVVGNINNSVHVFRDRIIPRINNSNIDFLVSAGNAVASGQEENYRAIYKTLERLSRPYLLTYGANEHSDFGSFQFYEHFGPHFFSFLSGDSHFIFLDGTGKSSLTWQLDWMERELLYSDAEHRFMFIGLPLQTVDHDLPPFESDAFLEPKVFRDALVRIAEAHGVDAVFSANLTLFSKQLVNGVEYVTTGGAGGMIVDSEDSFHHYVVVDVDEQGVNISRVRLDVDEIAWRRTLKSAWSTIYAFFYVSYLRFLLIVSVLVIAAIRLHRLIAEERHYYPNFEIDPTPYMNRPLRIGMYSNNYFPFVSGVSVSVDRLRHGLRSLGNEVLLFVPRYAEKVAADQGVIRVPTLLAFGEKGEFRLTNPLSLKFYRELKAFKPDIIHVHHPFWLGSLGLLFGWRLKVPVIYTYHTRLEHYAHFVPLPGMLFRNLISHYLIKRFSNRCQGVIVPTYSAEEYLRVLGVRTSTLVQPTGIDADRFRTIDDARVEALRHQYALTGKKVLISVSRISREKNIGFMLGALAVLRQWGVHNFHLLLVGDGPATQQVQDRIDELDLAEHVTLVGLVSPQDIVLYYHLGDVFVFASKSETQGMVILEAMAAGLPVVTVRSSGIDDVVRQGHNGFKAPENRHEWAQSLKELIEDDELRAALGHQAQAFATEYDISHFARSVSGFYAEVLAQYHLNRPRVR
ncbi:glycosyltransferase [Allohahella marinimesophila]